MVTNHANKWFLYNFSSKAHLQAKMKTLYISILLYIRATDQILMITYSFILETHKL